MSSLYPLSPLFRAARTQHIIGPSHPHSADPRGPLGLTSFSTYDLIHNIIPHSEQNGPRIYGPAVDAGLVA